MFRLNLSQKLTITCYNYKIRDRDKCQDLSPKELVFHSVIIQPVFSRVLCAGTRQKGCYGKLQDEIDTNSILKVSSVSLQIE